MIKITLTGEPKSNQHIYKTVCRGTFGTMYMSAEGKAIKEDYGWQAKSQWSGPPTTKPLRVKSTLYFKIKRNHDIDNYNKLVLDALSGIVWVDDGQIEELSITKKYDKIKPRCELVIYEL